MKGANTEIIVIGWFRRRRRLDFYIIIIMTIGLVTISCRFFLSLHQFNTFWTSCTTLS